MTKLEKLENDIRLYNEKIYETNTEIDKLEARIKEIQRIINNGDKWILAIGGVSFLVYFFGGLIHPIVSIIGLLMLPGMFVVHKSTDKIENEMNDSKKLIEEYKEKIISYNETLDNLTKSQEVQIAINQTIKEHTNNTVVVNSIEKENQIERNRR